MSKPISEPMVRSAAPIWHQRDPCLQIDQNEIPHDPRHLGVPSGVSKIISEHMVCLEQTTYYLASRLALSPNGPKQDSTRPTSPRSSISCVQTDFRAYGTFGANRAPIWHQREQCLQIDQNKIPHDPCHLGVPSGASKMISKPMVRSTQNRAPILRQD